MEDLSSDGGSTRRLTKLKSLNGDVSSLALTTPPGFFRRPRLHTQILDPYASSDSSNSPSPLTFRSSRGSRGGALSSIDNMPSLLRSPASIEEDVIIMGGIPVHSSTRRRSPSPSWLAGKENSLYLQERIRLGTKGQFSPGKEELRPSPLYNEKKDELCKLSSVGAYAYGSNSRIRHHQVNNDAPPSIKGPFAPDSWPALPTIPPPPPVEATSSSTAMPALATKASATKKGGRAEDHRSRSTGITSKYGDWCPLDDGIQVLETLSPCGKSLSREEVNAHIEAALYGPSLRSRLPVFAEFCPEPVEQQCLS